VRVRDDGGTADGGLDTSGPQTFTITFSAAPDAPSAAADAVTTDEDSAVTFDVLANDADADGDTVTLTGYDASALATGSLTANGGGSFTYLPAGGWAGTEMFTYTVSDGLGGSDGATVTITVTDVAHAPDAVDDAYTSDPDAVLTVSAPGLLANDSDHDGDVVTVHTSPVSAPTNGSVTLAADGGFTYAPVPGFTGTDTFAYRIDDGTGRTDVGTATIVVSSTVTSSVLYLGSVGADAETFGMTVLPPAFTGGSVPDWDGDDDTDPGLTIESSGGGFSESDPRKRQDWISPAPAAVDGPVVLHLTGAVDFFDLNKDVHPHVYLDDCAVTLASCTRLLETDVHINPWSLLGGWASHDIALGPLTHTFAPGRVLRMRLLIGHDDFWIALTGEHPSWLELTLP
jgi:hypothetical protein